MDKPAFSYHDGSLSPDTAAAGRLRVIVGADGFSWLATGSDGHVAALQSWQFKPGSKQLAEVESEVRSIFGQQTILGLPFGEVTYAFANPNVTLVPRRLFRPEDMASYLKLLIQPDDYQYGFDEIQELDCFAVYAVETNLLRMGTQYFPQGDRIHLATSLIRAFRNLNARSGYEVTVNLRNQVAEVLVFDRHILLFYNTFQFEQPNDLLYAILLAYDQFRLNPVETPLVLAGNLLEDSAIYRLFYRYFRHIRFATISGSSELPAQMAVLPAHCYFDILTLGS
jgi:hypothetical protein